ncbi:uncharacterized protein LOC110624109 isoform X4 [Manihot esculenta]|uniref:Uncharacterized protein n=1 Tax=Manihot esculenta TaxID=3983 RepID=A0ACB7GZ05_MANES|nr:uncharacterized protein LOC110624109 isoform X4 [Manihot esculenta]KAG8645216.1 hypothetical protein MANES_10G042100v8 [Manihot esculenta]
MSSKIDFQEFQFSGILSKPRTKEFSDDRSKVDIRFIQTLNHQNMDASTVLYTRDRDTTQTSSGCDLRKSLAWDSAFFTSPGVLDPEELLETLNCKMGENGSDMTGHMEPKSIPFESTLTPTNGIGNLRKSLAWDSAFFTSAGVLDAEELSIINGGLKRPETLPFPKFEEEIWRSTESNSTINSDCYSLASLEIDLFDDIKASIHKSRDASSNRATSTCKLKREKGTQNGHASKTPDSSSRLKYAGSSGESKSSSVKPPKVSARANPSSIIPSKRASLGTNHVKLDNKATNSTCGEGIAMSKKMCLRESCNIISSSKPSTKSPSSVLPAAKNEFMGFCYASGDFTGKSPSNPRRRTTDSRLAACGSSVRAPLKYLVKNKTKLVSSSDSICLPSTPKLSSYISPASSIDGWSSESSSTSINQRSKSSAASLVNTPLREISFDFSSSKASDSERPRYGKTLGHEIHETKLMDIQFNNVLMCTSTGSPNVSRKPTPSGLRMPSPKIGFFDAENSAVLAQDGGLKFQSGVQETSSKSGIGINNASGSANRTRYGKHRLAGTSTGPLSKTGAENEGKIYSCEKKQPLKEREDMRVICPENNVHRLGENNKENIGSLANQVDDLSQRMGAIDFS